MKCLIDALFVDVNPAKRAHLCGSSGANGDAVCAFVPPTRKNKLISESIWEQRPICAANLERPAEAHFSTRLQALQRLASTRRGAVDFTSALHP